MRRLLSLILDYLRNAVLFLFASSGIAALAVILLPLIGYMSFGDRPRTGWYGIPKHITWDAVLNTGGYALALSVFGAIPVLIGFGALLMFLLEVVTMLTNKKRRSVHDFIA